VLEEKKEEERREEEEIPLEIGSGTNEIRRTFRDFWDFRAVAENCT
jgi:hypothetical protein